MNILKDLDFSLSQCDFTDMFEEIHRFIFHIILIHIVNYIIDRKAKDTLFNVDLFKTLSITMIAVIL